MEEGRQTPAAAGDVAATLAAAVDAEADRAVKCKLGSTPTPVSLVYVAQYCD